MSSTSKLDTTFETTWRAKVGKEALAAADHGIASSKPTKFSGAVYYTQPSGADLFPEFEWAKALFNKLRRRRA